MATPNEISEASPCFSCIDDKLAALLYLLNQIRIEGGGDVMTVDEIAEASACFACLNDRWAAGLYLLSQVVVNGGVGGAQVFIDYAPGTPPTDTAKAALSFPSGGGSLSQWDVGSQAWV